MAERKGIAAAARTENGTLVVIIRMECLFYIRAEVGEVRKKFDSLKTGLFIRQLYVIRGVNYKFSEPPQNLSRNVVAF